MANVGTSISYNLRNLTRLQGRDAPRHYWPYIILLVGIHFIGGLLITIPVMVDAFTTAFHAVGQQANGAPPPDPQVMQAQMMQQMMGSMRTILPYSIALSLTVDALAIAATVRRLHDRNWSGWWSLLIVASVLLGLATNYWSMQMMARDGIAGIQQHMGTLQLLGWLPWVGYVILLIQLVQRGDMGDNRFGPEPDQSW